MSPSVTSRHEKGEKGEKNSSFFSDFIFVALLFSLQQRAAQAGDLIREAGKSPSNIAVAAVGERANSEISKVAARSEYFLIFDKNGGFLKSFKNQSQHLRRDASLGVLDLLQQESCTIVVAGKFGERMRNQLRAQKIEYYEMDGSAEKVIQAFLKKSE